MKVSIPQPCSEAWSAMQPTSLGRFCDTCDKTVIDYTGKSDKEILALLKRYPNGCGSFRINQLNRELEAKKCYSKQWLSIGALATFLGFSPQFVAQKNNHYTRENKICVVGDTKHMVTPTLDSLPANPVMLKQQTGNTIEIHVVDSTGNPIEFAKVLFLNTDSIVMRGFMTDRVGIARFEREKMPPNGEDFILQIRSFGYEIYSKGYNSNTLISTLTVQLRKSEILVQGIVVSYKFIPKHPFLYKLGSPIRRVKYHFRKGN